MKQRNIYIADRLKLVRESFGYSQKGMAEAIHTHTQTWRIYELGKSVPGGNVLKALCLLGININWLLTGEGDMKREAATAKTDLPNVALTGNSQTEFEQIITRIELLLLNLRIMSRVSKS